MAENKGKFIVRLALILLAVSAVMALALGVMNELTKEPIRIGAEEKMKKAYANVLDADTYEELQLPDGIKCITKLSAAKDASGTELGFVAESTFPGAQGMVTMVTGLDSELKCSGIYVTAHTETPGLGAKAADTSEGAWRDCVVGQGDGLALKKDDGEVDAIAGATITSKAIVNQIQSIIDTVSMLG